MTFFYGCRIITAMKTYYYIVQGRVQGVAFRYYTCQAARDYHITCTVKNLYNGDVEVYAQGNPDHIAQFEEFLHRGPRSAYVTQLLKEEREMNPVFNDFRVIY